MNGNFDLVFFFLQVLEERGAPRRREFVIEASVNGHSCTGVGPNKKIAKRNAAEALLNSLGYGNPPSNPKPVLKTEKESEIVDKTRKVTFVEEKTEPTPSVGGSGGRQLVPGILLVGDQSTNFQQVRSLRSITRTTHTTSRFRTNQRKAS